MNRTVQLGAQVVLGVVLGSVAIGVPPEAANAANVGTSTFAADTFEREKALVEKLGLAKPI